MRKVALFTIVFFMSLVMISCTGTEVDGEVDTEKKEERIQIGMAFDSFVIERWQRDRDVFVSVSKELGADVNVQNANGDIEEQRRQIEYFIEKDMDVIVIICIDSNTLQPEIQKAKEAGIKIIAYDRLIMNADVDLYISFDNYQVGVQMGEAIALKAIPECKVLLLGGNPADNNVPLLDSGFLSVMKENRIEVLDTMHADGWRAELAADYIYSHMGLVLETDAIMCGNDNMASQVVHALSEKRLAGEIQVVGQDADLEACQRIVEGTQLMTVYKPVEKLAQKAAECAIMLAKGQVIEREETIFDGTQEVTYIAMEPISVTEENINEVIINSGFHLKEDVYLNVPSKMP